MWNDVILGASAGLAVVGAWLTADAYFRSDARIDREEALIADGGAGRILRAQEAARIGQVGVACTAASIILTLFADGPPIRWWAAGLALVLSAFVGLGAAGVRRARFRRRLPAWARAYHRSF